jgi:hypothetical protein
MATDRAGLLSCFLSLISTFKTQTSFTVRLGVLEFILGGIIPSMFPLFVESGLADLIACGCDDLDTEYSDFVMKSPLLDSLCFEFLSRNCPAFIVFLNAPPLLHFQKVVSRRAFPQSRFLLQMVYTTDRFAMSSTSRKSHFPRLPRFY